MKKTSDTIYTLSPDELRRMQAVLLEMLCELDRICRKCDIRYVLDAGTMLGAVRHGGFIPWDDDIDVVMMRPDYERFRVVCQKELDADRYFYQDHTTDPHYRWGYARLRRKNSEFVRVGQEHMRMQTGIFLDIFPRDNVPDMWLPRVFQNAYCFVLRKILYSEAGIAVGETALQRAAYRLLYRIPATFVFRRLEKMAAHWNRKPTELVRTLTFPIQNRCGYGYKRGWFENTVDTVFEDHIFQGMRDYDEFLTALYGDYMTPPPPEKRHWHPVSKFRLPEDG
jgi:lipopolysaccharide cholinephosphotransferase